MAAMKIALSIEEAADYKATWRKILIKKDSLELFMAVNEGRDLRDRGNVKTVTRKTAIE